MLSAPGPHFGTWDTTKPNSNAQIQTVADLAANTNRSAHRDSRAPLPKRATAGSEGGRVLSALIGQFAQSARGLSAAPRSGWHSVALGILRQVAVRGGRVPAIFFGANRGSQFAFLVTSTTSSIAVRLILFQTDKDWRRNTCCSFHSRFSFHGLRWVPDPFAPAQADSKCIAFHGAASFKSLYRKRQALRAWPSRGCEPARSRYSARPVGTYWSGRPRAQGSEWSRSPVPVRCGRCRRRLAQRCNPSVSTPGKCMLVPCGIGQEDHSSRNLRTPFRLPVSTAAISSKLLLWPPVRSRSVYQRFCAAKI